MRASSFASPAFSIPTRRWSFSVLPISSQRLPRPVGFAQLHHSLDALCRQILVSGVVELLLATSSKSTFDAQLLLDMLTLIEHMETTSTCRK